MKSNCCTYLALISSGVLALLARMDESQLFANTFGEKYAGQPENEERRLSGV
jgi:hypothetical protein